METKYISQSQLSFGLTSSLIVERALAKIGDINTILSKSRLRLKFDAIFKSALSGDNFDFNQLQSLLIEVHTFSLDQYDFIRAVTQNFMDDFQQNWKSNYTQLIINTLQGMDQQAEEATVQDEMQEITQACMTNLFNIFTNAKKILTMIQTGFPQLGNIILRLYDILKNGIARMTKVNLKKVCSLFFIYGFMEFENISAQIISQYFQSDMDSQQIEEIPLINIEGDVSQIIFGQFNGNFPSQYNGQMQKLQTLSNIIINLGLSEYLEVAFEKILLNQVDKYLDQIRGEFIQPCLKIVQDYLQNIISRWVKDVVNLDQTNDSPDIKLAKQKILSKWERDLEHTLLTKFVSLRTKDIFEIFQEFPDSMPSINDFKYALEKTQLHKQFVNQVKEQFSQRLLLPGVITFIIIEHYIQAIRVLKLIDPSTILLEMISEPIKDHLRQRQDTLRCIVQSILADESELYNQLGQAYVRIPLRGSKNNKLVDYKQNAAEYNGGPSGRDDDNDDYISSDEDEQAAENWEPLPLQNDMRDFFISAKRKKTDIISTLVNIYGSQDAFLKVYKSMLEERLLSGNEIKQENEIRNLELMKLRFGDQNLHSSDVMLRDIKESERIRIATRQIIEKKQNETGRHVIYGSSELPIQNLNACIISKGYWDSIQEDDTGNQFKPPKFLQKAYDDFEAIYQSLKRIRKVNFKPQLGSVNLTLHFNNGSFKFRVTPIQASIISLFNDKNPKTLSADFIADQLDIKVDEVRRKVSFWVCKGVLKEIKKFKQIGTSHYRSTALLSNSDVEIYYQSVDILELKGDQRNSEKLIEANELVDFTQQDQIIRIQQVQSQDDDKLVRGFVMNIISNSNTPCNFDRIFTMLKNVYMNGQNIQKPGLEELLFKMTNEQKISFNGQVYTAYSK
ncbi:anaphase-promoting complex subunit 2 [Stylonychia lemnae]|uniref:Anaphase-promoting complex subunit 2 n=1 Tax=Stylonychia lemnae TaxID=5949 RepID=A0A077ZVP3_STYLE|nr:anaphase-promoting complex subunit 2 [Stylonychia lemnae]|eukprot:CDW73691.1 anaphase-promoting complex subunit 2 [Stylonychia lemnae]